MTKRFVSSIVVALSLCALLFVATAVLSPGSTQAGPVSAAQSQGEGAEKGQGSTEQPRGTWSDVAPFPTISVTEWYPCNPQPCTPTGVNVSARIKRAGASGYHPNGKLYMMGGRHGLDGQEDYPLRWIWEYDPLANTWTRKNALLEGTQSRDRFVANMAVATLTDTTGVRVYAVGGSNVDSVPSNLVRSYDPVADSITQLTGDVWPATPVRIPGGWAVHDNKLYIFGGFSLIANGGQGSVFTDTWRFDPMAPVGSKWTQLDSMNLGRGYIGGAAVNGKLYAVGGDTWDAATRTLTPVSNVEMLDLAQPSPTWVDVAPLPDARGDLGAWGYDSGTPYEIAGKVMAAGGSYPVPSANSYLYDPASNTWTSAPPMVHATRNFARAQLNGYLYAFGGYDYTNNTPNGANWNQRYDATGPVGTSTPTTTGTPPTSTPTLPPTNTPAATPTACQAGTYTIATATATIVPGTTNIGSSCDDCITDVALPFPFTLYNQAFTSVGLDSNGKAHFPSGDSVFSNSCLPQPGATYSIYPYWDDLRTDTTGSGIFTSISGSAPNRIFNIEWRTTYFSGGGTANFELRLYEGTSGRFDVIYGTVSQGNASATGGVQLSASAFTQDFCNGSGSPATGARIYTLQGGCPTNTPGPSHTATATSTATVTNTATATNTAIATDTPEVTVTATPTSCTLEFTDVPVTNTVHP
ncbi:MAG TPA: hypothetical protein VFR15_04410, partial [Chloroflexia bacterium]|nr:hypothetical protein [Chloroflexia bacterium]